MSAPVVEVAPDARTGHDVHGSGPGDVHGPGPVPDDPGGPTPWLAVLVAFGAVLLAVAVAVLSGADGPAGWRLAEGVLEDAGGVPLAPEALLPDDAELTAGREGARIVLGGSSVELAPGARLAVRSDVLVPASGALLVDSDQRLVEVRLPRGVASGRGTFRVDRGGVERLASYDAAVALDGARPVAAGRLEELVLDTTGAVLQPIRLDPDDPWDQRHAARPLATDAYAARLATGLAATYGTAPQPGAFYADFVGVTEGVAEALPGLAPRQGARLFGPPAEVLVAAAALDALAAGTARPVDELAPTVVEARAAGATWGVLLGREGLGDDDLRRSADEALRRRADLGQDATPVTPPVTPDPPTAAPPAPDTPPDPDADVDPDPDPDDTTDPDDGRDPEPEPDPDDEPDPDGEPDPDPVEELLDEVTEPVLDLLDDVEPVDPLADLLDGVTDSVRGLVVEDLLGAAGTLVGDLLGGVLQGADGLLEPLLGTSPGAVGRTPSVG